MQYYLIELNSEPEPINIHLPFLATSSRPLFTPITSCEVFVFLQILCRLLFLTSLHVTVRDVLVGIDLGRLQYGYSPESCNKSWAWYVIQYTTSNELTYIIHITAVHWYRLKGKVDSQWNSHRISDACLSNSVKCSVNFFLDFNWMKVTIHQFWQLNRIKIFQLKASSDNLHLLTVSCMISFLPHDVLSAWKVYCFPNLSNTCRSFCFSSKLSFYVTTHTVNSFQELFGYWNMEDLNW